jgi:hypothetical protein
MVKTRGKKDQKKRQHAPAPGTQHMPPTHSSDDVVHFTHTNFMRSSHTTIKTSENKTEIEGEMKHRFPKRTISCTHSKRPPLKLRCLNVFIPATYLPVTVCSRATTCSTDETSTMT